MMHNGIQSYICQQNYSMLEVSDMVFIAILADFDPWRVEGVYWFSTQPI